MGPDENNQQQDGDGDYILVGQGHHGDAEGFQQAQQQPGQYDQQKDGRQEEHGDGDRRRSIYQDVRRNFLNPFLLAFDQPIPFSSFGRRNLTNIPAQALAMMNDPFVHLQASRLAEQVLALAESERLTRAYLQTLGRLPNSQERAAAVEFLGPQPDPQAWADFCHALFNHKEFLFIH